MYLYSSSVSDSICLFSTLPFPHRRHSSVRIVMPMRLQKEFGCRCKIDLISGPLCPASSSSIPIGRMSQALPAKDQNQKKRQKVVVVLEGACLETVKSKKV